LPKLELVTGRKSRSIWRHGTVLKDKYLTFEVDKNLINRYTPKLKEHDKNIVKVLDNLGTKCDWQSLFTHPKLMKSYFWKDQRIYTKQ